MFFNFLGYRRGIARVSPKAMCFSSKMCQDKPLPPPDLPPLPPPDLPPCAGECGESISDFNESVLKGWCKSCFDRELALRLTKPEGEAEFSTPSPKKAFSSPPVDDGQEQSGAQEPTFAWSRRTRESEQVWFSRVQGHLDGSRKRKREEYLVDWRERLTEKEKAAFRSRVSQLRDGELGTSRSVSDEPFLRQDEAQPIGDEVQPMEVDATAESFPARKLALAEDRWNGCLNLPTNLFELFPPVFSPLISFVDAGFIVVSSVHV